MNRAMTISGLLLLVCIVGYSQADQYVRNYRVEPPKPMLPQRADFGDEYMELGNHACFTLAEDHHNASCISHLLFYNNVIYENDDSGHIIIPNLTKWWGWPSK